MSKFVVAVSGGVDSMALLHMFSKNEFPISHFPFPISQLIVAHFDHGIRPGSYLDAQLVEATASKYNLSFELGVTQLGPGASEDAARRARYDFLETVRTKHKADGIIAAHHQDDEIETAIINLLRGTGYRGLTPMRSNKKLIRPLLDTPKAEIINYAKANKLKWREDSTNTDIKYLRNKVRTTIMPNLAPGQSARDSFLKLIHSSSRAGLELDDELGKLLFSRFGPASLERQLINNLPHRVGRELVATWLRANGLNSYDKKTLERLAMAAKTGRPGSRQPAGPGFCILVGKTKLSLQPNG